MMRKFIILLLCLLAISCAKPTEGGNVAKEGDGQENKSDGNKRLERKARKTVEEHLKDKSPDISDVKLDLFYTSPQFPDKAYTSVTVTHSLATVDGKPQREFLGLLLLKDGDDWKVADGSNPKYTVSPEEADRYLAGAR